jgi:hypothetical protein
MARPSGSRHGRDRLDAHREVEVAHEAADDHELLGVLLAEEGHVGPDHVEELGDDRGHAGEVPGAADGALHRLADAGDGDRRGEAGRVDDLGRRGEQDVGAGLGGQLGVAGLVARVGVEVGGLVELRGVDEQRHDDGRAALARCRTEARWPVVQARPWWDQADRPRRVAQRGADVLDGAHGDHAGTLRRPARSRVRRPARRRARAARARARRPRRAGARRGLVAAGDRAGQRLLGPRRAQLSTVWRTSGTSSSGRRPGGARRPSSSVTEEVRGDRTRRVVGGAVLVGDLDGAEPEARGEVAGEGQRGGVEPATAAPAREGLGRLVAGERHQRMDAEGVDVAGQDVEAGGPAAVADEQVVARRQTSRGGGDLAVRDAQEDRRGGTRVGATAQGTVDREAGGAQSAGEGAAQTAGPMRAMSFISVGPVPRGGDTGH